LSDLEMPSTVDHMVRFIENSLEERASESDLGNIHIGQSPLPVPEFVARQNTPERQAPLYMRKPGQSSGPSQTQHGMSYAGALRRQPVVPQPHVPVVPLQSDLRLPVMTGPPKPDSGPSSPETDPLDLLKNLNIKASPGTQALYQYFS